MIVPEVVIVCGAALAGYAMRLRDARVREATAQAQREASDQRIASITQETAKQREELETLRRAVNGLQARAGRS